MTDYEIKISIREKGIFSQEIEGTLQLKSNLAKKELGMKIVNAIKDLTYN